MGEKPKRAYRVRRPLDVRATLGLQLSRRPGTPRDISVPRTALSARRLGQEQLLQNGLLGMQTVFRLLVDETAITVEQLTRDLLASVRG